MLPIDSWTAPHEPHRSSRSRHHRWGPRGAPAAIEARRAGVGSVVVLDEGIAPGGQIFRRYGPGFSVTDPHAAGHEYSDGHALIAEAQASGADIRSSAVVWGAWEKKLAFVSNESTPGVIEAKAIIIATGARDRAVAFPGWTMPGVITAGAAKTLVAIQRVLPGKRILMAGSGPLALAFSAQLREYGANIVEVAEAAPRPNPIDFVRLALHGDPSVLMDAARYRARLMLDRIRFSYATMVVRAEGQREVERAVIAKVDHNWHVIPSTERSIEVDTVILGYGLESNSEMSRLLNCEQVFDRTGGGWLPVRDTRMRTSVPGIYAAGDGGGVGGSHSALQQGRIAGIAAATELGVVSEREAQRALPSRCGGSRASTASPRRSTGSMLSGQVSMSSRPTTHWFAVVRNGRRANLTCWSPATLPTSTWSAR